MTCATFPVSYSSSTEAETAANEQVHCGIAAILKAEVEACFP
jgi:hypothetical protein